MDYYALAAALLLIAILSQHSAKHGVYSSSRQLAQNRESTAVRPKQRKHNSSPKSIVIYSNLGLPSWNS
ncbi:hypothetical protein KY289_001261 [Solanum tuberosum]|nr:hypothetical protein KY289_001261 [Solanum tuberosum]